MDLVEVDGVDQQAVGAGRRPLLHDARQGNDGQHLGGEEGLIPPALDGAADGALGTTEGVDLGGVDEVDPEVEGPAGDVARLSLGVLVAVAPLP